MSNYKIVQAQKDNAKKLNVSIKPSSNKGKKIDVFKGDKKVASIGAINYQDYHKYIKSEGKKYADDRKRLYKIRHEKTRGKIGTNSFYADKILWK